MNPNRTNIIYMATTKGPVHRKQDGLCCIFIFSGMFFWKSFFYACILLLQSAAYAEDINSSIITTNVFLQATMLVQTETTGINQEISGVGDIEVTALFSVTANTKRVAMFVETTPFYLNGETEDPETASIRLDESAGVEIDPEGAMIVENTTPLNYVGDGNPVEGYPSRKTDLISFESADFIFNKPTSVTVRWIQDDPEKPAGTYHAKVKLTCIAQMPD